MTLTQDALPSKLENYQLQLDASGHWTLKYRIKFKLEFVVATFSHNKSFGWSRECLSSLFNQLSVIKNRAFFIGKLLHFRSLNFCFISMKRTRLWVSLRWPTSIRFRAASGSSSRPERSPRRRRCWRSRRWCPPRLSGKKMAYKKISATSRALETIQEGSSFAIIVKSRTDYS